MYIDDSILHAVLVQQFIISDCLANPDNVKELLTID